MSLLAFIVLIPWVLTSQGCSKWSTSQTVTSVYESTKNSANSLLHIHEIQGATHFSPIEGEMVTGVIGNVTYSSIDGFYMQSQDPDTDPATSEGIWVATSTKSVVSPGNLVSVAGLVNEYYPGGINGGGLSITQIKLSDLEILATNLALPDPVIIGKNGRNPPNKIIEDDQFVVFDPSTDGIDFYESLEGMLVILYDAIAIAPTDAHGEIGVIVDNGETAGERSITGGIILQEGDANPERILMDDAFVPSPSVKIGTKFPEIVGFIDYSYGNYKLQPIDQYQYTNANPEPIEIADSSPGQLRIASYNVENLDAKDPDKRFEVLADHIVNHLKSPDIIGLQEIQDNNGSYEDKIVDASQTWERIVWAILDVGGPLYEYRDINPLRNTDGGEEGGNGRVGFLFRTDTGIEFVDRGEPDAITGVQVVNSMRGVQLSINPGRIQPNNSSFVNSRKPLIGEFRFNGDSFFIINLHLVSKGDDTPLFGYIQPPLEKSEFQRINQVNIIYHFIQELTKLDPNVKLIILGDFNDFQWSDTLLAIKGTSLMDMVSTLPLDEQFTYIFEGNSQALDHILVSEAVADEIVDYEIIHVNTLFPSRDRLSDHDPQLLTVNFKK